MANQEALDQAIAQFRRYPSNELLDMAGSPNWALLTHQAVREVLKERGLDAPPLPELPEEAYVEPSFQTSGSGDAASTATPDASGSAAQWYGGRRSDDASSGSEDRRDRAARPSASSAWRLPLAIFLLVGSVCRLVSSCEDLRSSSCSGSSWRSELSELSVPAQLPAEECDREDAKACTLAGRLYQQGFGLRRSEERALQYFTPGCSHGDREGCFLQVQAREEADLWARCFGVNKG